MQSRTQWLSWCLLLARITFVQSTGNSSSSPPGVVDATVTQAAVEALMTFYNYTDGRWDGDGPWWHSAVALQAVLDYMIQSGTRQYLAEAENTVQIQRAPVPWWPQGGGDFRGDSTDDTAWWGLAMTTMYEVTGNSEYLDIAKEDEKYIFDYWNTSACGGGVIWEIPNRSYRSAISNELYLQLTATLHNLIPGDEEYLKHSLIEWEWFKASGLINSAHLVNDGLTDSCANNGATTWTYNQGVILAGLVELWKATGDASLLATATEIADAVVNSPTLSPGGILTEPCASAADCEPNAPTFKGTFIRSLVKLNAVLHPSPYGPYIQANAYSAYTYDRNGSTDYYGMLWQGPFDTATAGRQASAVNLFIAAGYSE
ncbi:glycoside hydrolase family 76 protein [Xylariomycetidae sp. FL2044]|nr:glycoside hydrolase family 76 protein [Xylariomycetidae sp. FL2044]